MLLALTLGQFTSVQLPPLQFEMDTTRLSITSSCDDNLGKAYARLTNNGRAVLFVTQGLVIGPNFNGALQGGELGDVKPGEYTAMGATYIPGGDPKPRQAQFEILVRYHDTTVEEERERIRKLAQQKLDELKAQSEKLEEDFVDRFERLSMKMRLAHQRIETANNKKRVQGLERLDELKTEYKRKRREYERGRFCSGCSKTESEILKTGSHFPHPGESVVPATRAQLDALDREWKGKIEAQENRLDELQAETRRSYDEMMRRVRDFEVQRSQERAALEEKLEDLKKKQNEIIRQRGELEHELHEKSTQSKTVLVKVFGRCTKGKP
jgi:hypothetical protein